MLTRYIIIFLCLTFSIVGCEKNLEETVEDWNPVYEEYSDEKPLLKSRDWDGDQDKILALLAMDFAADEDEKTKMLIILTALNRVWSDEFPDTLEDVVSDLYEEKKTGIHYDNPDDSCYEALYKVKLGGWNESNNALYFIKEEDTWFHSEKHELACASGEFYFYK